MAPSVEMGRLARDPLSRALGPYVCWAKWNAEPWIPPLTAAYAWGCTAPSGSQSAEQCGEGSQSAWPWRTLGGLNTCPHSSPGQVGTQKASGLPLEPWQGQGCRKAFVVQPLARTQKKDHKSSHCTCVIMSGLCNRNYRPCFTDEETEAPVTQPGSERARASPGPRVWLHPAQCA